MEKRIIVVALILGVLSADLFSLSGGRVSETEKKFQRFIVEYEKDYDTVEEYFQRLEIFEANLKRFEEHNSNPSSTYTMGINRFADMLPEEFNQHKIKLPVDMERTGRALVEDEGQVNHFNILKEKFGVESDVTIDWTKLGVVGSVGNAGQYQQGTSFMITQTINSAKAIRDQTKLQTKYSYQELRDCTEDLQSAIEFTVSKGIERFDEYSNSGSGCNYDPTKYSLNVKEWDLIQEGQSEVMKTRLTGQPLLTLVSANSGAFMYYTGGVITSGCFESSELDHSVLLVGYDNEKKTWKA